MSFGQIVQHIYLPLLTQETAIMISTFTYGLNAGAGAPLLVLVNTAAVITDILLFFVPIHFLSQPLHDSLIARFQRRYDTGMRIVERFGAFRTAVALGFVMPSVAAMIVVGLLRLSFWRALAGLLVGSVVYVIVPLLVALPLAPALPRFLVPALPWVAPALGLILVLYTFLRWRFGKHGRRTETTASSGD